MGRRRERKRKRGNQLTLERDDNHVSCSESNRIALPSSSISYAVKTETEKRSRLGLCTEEKNMQGILNDLMNRGNAVILIQARRKLSRVVNSLKATEMV